MCTEDLHSICDQQATDRRRTKKGRPGRESGLPQTGASGVSAGILYREGGPPVPLVEDAGGQGVPEGDVPGVAGVVELPGFPGVEEPEVEPGLGVDPDTPGVPGRFGQGDPVGLGDGLVFGSMVDGFALLPGIGGFVEFEPGTPVGVVGLGFVGVDVLPGGVAVPGVWLCPELAGLPVGGVPPDGGLCATARTALNRDIDSKLSFVADIGEPPALRFQVLVTTRLPRIVESLRH